MFDKSQSRLHVKRAELKRSSRLWRPCTIRPSRARFSISKSHTQVHLFICCALRNHLLHPSIIRPQTAVSGQTSPTVHYRATQSLPIPQRKKENPQITIHIPPAPPYSLNPPPAVLVPAAILVMSSTTSQSNSPVTAEHSAYRSARISTAACNPSSGMTHSYRDSSISSRSSTLECTPSSRIRPVCLASRFRPSSNSGIS